jgi:hypothetical protein
MFILAVQGMNCKCRMGKPVIFPDLARHVRSSARAVVWVVDHADHGEPDRTPLHSSTEDASVPQWC